jgi:hypothetical protein
MEKSEKSSKQVDNLLKTIYVPKYHNSKNKNSKAPVDEAKLDQFVRYIQQSLPEPNYDI